MPLCCLTWSQLTDGVVGIQCMPNHIMHEWCELSLGTRVCCRCGRPDLCSSCDICVVSALRVAAAGDALLRGSHEGWVAAPVRQRLLQPPCLPACCCGSVCHLLPSTAADTYLQGGLWGSRAPDGCARSVHIYSNKYTKQFHFLI